jgi:dTDP-4-dehydrorhamnose reductase
VAQREWWVIGPTGQLGRELLEQAAPEGIALRAIPRADLDLARPDTVRDFFSWGRVALVINAAAWTDVDGAESQESRARAVNADGVAALAEACRHAGSHLIHVSTDYVFGGERPNRLPWAETDPLRPQGVYARTKAEGELAVREILPERGTIVRTAWLYSGHGRNFVRTMLDKARAGEPASVVRDQWGQPTWARDVATRILTLGERLADGRAPAGIYHATNSGQTTWWEFARWIYSLADADPGLVAPMASSDLNRPAPRPAWSVLGHGAWERAELPPLRPWREALVSAMPELDKTPGH